MKFRVAVISGRAQIKMEVHEVSWFLSKRPVCYLQKMNDRRRDAFFNIVDVKTRNNIGPNTVP